MSLCKVALFGQDHQILHCQGCLDKESTCRFKTVRDICPVEACLPISVSKKYQDVKTLSVVQGYVSSNAAQSRAQ